MSEIPDALREAYVTDVIDVETFERFVGLHVSGESYALPLEVLRLRSSSQGTPHWFSDYLSSVNRVAQSRPQSSATLSAVLKDAWLDA